MKIKTLIGVLGGISACAVVSVVSWAIFDHVAKENIIKQQVLEKQWRENCQKDDIECRKIESWIQKTGGCEVMVENVKDHPTNNSKSLPYYAYADYLYGLSDELDKDNESYKSDCENKKVLQFQFDNDESQWIYKNKDTSIISF